MTDIITIEHNKVQAKRIDELYSELERFRSVHWFLIIYCDRVTGRCSDGRTFVESAINPLSFLRGFYTSLNMCGHTYEIRDER